jgi:hypothetical protein
MKIRFLLLALSSMLLSPPSFAESQKVIASLRGIFFILRDDVAEKSNDQATIAAYKAARLTSISGQVSGSVTNWSFHYNAFPSAKWVAANKLMITFTKAGSAPVTYSLTGVGPTDVLRGDVRLSTDDGITRGSTYSVNLMLDTKAGKQSLASTPLAFK